MATHSSIHAWRIPWTEELGGLVTKKIHTPIQITVATNADKYSVLLIFHDTDIIEKSKQITFWIKLFLHRFKLCF